MVYIGNVISQQGALMVASEYRVSYRPFVAVFAPDEALVLFVGGHYRPFVAVFAPDPCR